jgi:hypothetical protein
MIDITITGEYSGSSIPDGTVSIVNFALTSLGEMEELFSEAGINFRREDYEDDTDEYVNVVNRRINEATHEAWAILGKVFERNALVSQVWVRRRVTQIACYLMSIRLGNPSQYLAEYQDALADFQDLVDGNYYLEGLARRSSVAVQVLNVSSDNRSPFIPIRVDWISATDTVGVKWLQSYLPFTWI